MPDTKIHVASKNRPIVTRYEPGFRRVYAKGGLVSRDAEPDPMLRLGLWSERVNLKMANKVEGVGYALEAEVVLSLDAARRIRDLISYWLERKPSGDGPTQLDSVPQEKD